MSWKFLCLFLISFPTLLPNNDPFLNCIFIKYPFSFLDTVFQIIHIFLNNMLLVFHINGIGSYEFFCYSIMRRYVALVDSVFYCCVLTHYIAKPHFIYPPACQWSCFLFGDICCCALLLFLSCLLQVNEYVLYFTLYTHV